MPTMFDRNFSKAIEAELARLATERFDMPTMFDRNFSKAIEAELARIAAENDHQHEGFTVVEDELDRLAAEKPVEDEDYITMNTIPVFPRWLYYTIISWCLAVFWTVVVAIVRAIWFSAFPPLVVPLTFFLVFGGVLLVLFATCHD